jgi:anti-sigma factor RsiW
VTARTQHPGEERLLASLLGDLPAEGARAVEAHLADCEACRAARAELDAMFAASVEALPQERPPAEAWPAIQRRIAASAAGTPGRGAPKTSARTAPARAPGQTPPHAARSPRTGAPRWALVATLALAVAMGGWALWQRQATFEARARIDALEARVQLLESVAGTVQARADSVAGEQARLVRWLARDDATLVRLPVAPDGLPHGSVVVLPDDRALIALRELPPEGRAYQAWGVRDGAFEPLAVFDTRTVEVDGAPYAELAVSLEADGGAASPSRLLGRIEVP